MIFSSFEFFVFFAVVFIYRWYINPLLFPEENKETRAAHYFLLFASYFFYMSWDYRFGALIFLSTIIDYALGIAISKTESQKQKKSYLLASILLNLVFILGFFKYYTFLTSNANALFKSAGLSYSFPLVHIILPVGISFFTFQSLSYTIDVYRGVIPYEKDFVRFALFVSFFPQLVAGPIVTAKTFLPQLAEKIRFEDVPFRIAIRFFMLGYFKKVLIADNAAPIVDMVFKCPWDYGADACWVGAILFVIQIYGDFSGYSDMAYGSALLLGYKLPENFRLPYLAKSVTEFWGMRWHMSLSIWIRDYVYIPLGGSRVSYFRHKFNIWFTMLLAGIWHGAAWTFVIWGAIQGFVIIIESWIVEARTKLFPSWQPDTSKVIRLCKIVFTFLLITFICSWFRATSVDMEIVMIKQMLSFEKKGLRVFMYNRFLILTGITIIGHYLGYKIFEAKKTWQISKRVEFASYTLLVLVFALYTNDNETPFIYFAF
ncbi:MAG: MBOAT family O-acyltransferase [Spirochaetota bacterium]